IRPYQSVVTHLDPLDLWCDGLPFDETCDRHLARSLGDDLDAERRHVTLDERHASGRLALIAHRPDQTERIAGVPGALERRLPRQVDLSVRVSLEHSPGRPPRGCVVPERSSHGHSLAG